MIIVGFSLAGIAAAVFFAWYYIQQWRASRASRVQYYQPQRSERRYSESAEPIRPLTWL
jgi:hypothetical protein